MQFVSYVNFINNKNLNTYLLLIHTCITKLGKAHQKYYF